MSADSRTRSRSALPLPAVRDLRLDESYLRRVVDHLCSIGSSPLGFRTTGTPEDAAVAAFVRAEMLDMGLADVAVEDVEVDAWRFRAAVLQVAGGARYEGASFGGVPPTAPGGLHGLLADIGTGERHRLDGRDLTGAVALLDWRDPRVAPSAIALELARRGVAGMILNCPDKGAWYQSPGALGAFDGQWPAGGPPMMTLRQADAAALRERLAQGPLTAHMTLDVDLAPRTAGHNVVGYLPGERRGPIVVGAHHDGWFRAAWDNASGVATMLAIARALAGSGYPLRHTVCFSTRTAEEYGITDSIYDWCIGAWRQVTATHPEWAGQAPFHLCLEATGHRSLKVLLETPVELAGWARRACRAADREGWLPTGWRVGPPHPGTELWPFLVSGVPGVAAYTWEKAYSKTDYHTQFDTASILDFAYMGQQARLYALLLLDADRDPDAIIDHRARARELAAIAATGPDGGELAAAAEQHRAAHGRRAFTRTGRGLIALDAHMRACYPHEQASSDIAALEAAIEALEKDDRAAAYRQLRKVGHHLLFPFLSETAFRDYNRRSRGEAVSRSWAGRSHLTASPEMWREMAALRGGRAPRPYGPWVGNSLARALEKSRQQRRRRLAAMARAVGPRTVTDNARSS